MELDNISQSDHNHKSKESASPHLNGLSNGYSDKHKSYSKDKHKDKDKEKDRNRSKSHHHKDHHKDKEHKEKNKEKDHHRSKSSSNNNSSSSKHKSSSKEKDRDKEREKDKEKDKHHRDKSKEHRNSSSSSSKDHKKHKHDKHKHHKDKEREKDKDKDRDEKNKSKVKEEINNSMDKVASVHIKKEEQLEYVNDSYKEQKDISADSSCDYNLSNFKTEPEDSDEDTPLTTRLDSSSIKRKHSTTEDEDFKQENRSENSDDDIPLKSRKKIKTEVKTPKSVKKKRRDDDSESESDQKSKKKKNIKDEKTNNNKETSPKKKKKKEEEEQEVWKWWEEDRKDDGTKWKFLEHKGPLFAPLYEPLPSNVKFYYNGEAVRLNPEAEEVAGFYAKMLDHDYTTKDIFNQNFFKDWRKTMTDEEKSFITSLKKCNFKEMHTYFLEVAERNRNRTKEEKQELKKKNEELQKEYGICIIDGHKEKIGNFKIEPPGLFRGRGEHPKMGMLKKRVQPEDVIINCSKDSKFPVPPVGHKWKEVRHDQSVTWLASWTENVQNQVKYVMLNPSSKLKGEKDMQKYEMARKLAKTVDKIRNEYREDWKSKEMRIRQRAVALYFIDRLALRAGNEKDDDQADTVGCCSLRIEHIQLKEEKDGKDYVVIFDFLGKDSIRYYNEVPVEKRVFKNLQLFMENKAPGDDLFDRLNTSILNKHLNELMEGLTAKVFRTYNASWTLQQQLNELTNKDDSLAEKILSYNRANRAVAILCNHQRSVPKSHAKSMEKLKEKIEQKREQIAEAEKQVKNAQRDAKHGSVKEKVVYDKKKKMLERLREQLTRLEVQETDRDENKSIALGTSKLNYLDPRISVAWCKKYEVPIEKIYNKTQRDKFRWAIDMAGPDYVF